MSIHGVAHQKAAIVARIVVQRGEALQALIIDETPSPRQEAADAGKEQEQSVPRLLEQALARENMQRAWKRVKKNRGAAGVDGMDILQTGQHLQSAWPQIRQALLTGRYRPSPVRRVMIAKPDGSLRELGIPTVTDRLIQQALLQVLQPMIDPSFSAHSHGFRPGRRAQDAVLKAQQHVQAGYTIVVDVDLEKFFDRINHDVLMERLKRRIEDDGVIRLIRAYLNAGIMGTNGVVADREEGTPQGGPLSPFLANVLLDEVDRALERRGHRFERYADDCNVYVKSQRAGERVMKQLKGLYGKLRLKINESKSAVTSALGRKFLGYSLWAAPKGEVKRAVSQKSCAAFKGRFRRLTRRSAGRSMEELVLPLRRYVLGWRAYYGLAQTPGVWRELDGWMRHRLRSIQLKHWKRGKTAYRECLKLGAPEWLARKVAANCKRWWHNSGHSLNGVLTVAYFDRLGFPRLT